MIRHTVVRGDSLSRLGRQYGVAWRDIAAANDIGAPYVLTVGRVLIIPVRDDAPPEAELLVDNEAAGYTAHRWRRYEPVRWLIMHDPVGGTVANTLAYLRKNDRQVSYNELLCPSTVALPTPTSHVLAPPDYYVGHAGYSTLPDGTRGPACNRAAWGCCIYKRHDDEGPFPPALERAAVRLAAVRCRQFGIGADRVLAHREVDPKRRRDPRGLDMGIFREMVARALR